MHVTDKTDELVVESDLINATEDRKHTKNVHLWLLKCDYRCVFISNTTPGFHSTTQQKDKTLCSLTSREHRIVNVGVTPSEIVDGIVEITIPAPENMNCMFSSDYASFVLLYFTGISVVLHYFTYMSLVLLLFTYRSVVLL